LSGPTDEAERVAELFAVVQSQHAGRQTQFVARIDTPLGFPNGWMAESISLGELVLAYLREPSASAMTGPLAMAAKRAGR